MTVASAGVLVAKDFKAPEDNSASPVGSLNGSIN